MKFRCWRARVVLPGPAELSHAKRVVSTAWPECHLSRRNARSRQRPAHYDSSSGGDCHQNQDTSDSRCWGWSNDEDTWPSGNQWPTSHRQNVKNIGALCCHMVTAIKHPVPDRVEPSFVIFDIRALWRPGRQGARMSKITNPATGCFMAVPIWQQ